MKNFCYILFILTLLFPNNHVRKCGLSLNNNSRADRYVMDTYYPSLSGNFRVHYDTSGNDAPNLISSDGDEFPDYIQAVAEQADYVRYVITEQMGFNPEAPDDNGIYDIYILDQAPGHYGYNRSATTYDDGTPYEGTWSGYTGRESFLELDNKYEASDFATTGTEGMKITLAHEFFHAIQRTYFFSDDDLYFWELSSVWMEDVLYPNINDYSNWGEPYDVYPEVPPTAYKPYNYNANYFDAGYALALFGHYLVKTYDEVEDGIDSEIMKLIWEEFNGIGVGSAVTAINTVLAANYETDYLSAWTDFSARNIFNGKFEDSYNQIYYYNDQKDFDSILTYDDYSSFTLSYANQSYMDDQGNSSFDMQIDVNIPPSDCSIDTPCVLAADQDNITIENINHGVNIESYLVNETCALDLDVSGSSPLYGRLSIVSIDSQRHRIYELQDQLIPLDSGDILHIIYGNDDTIDEWDSHDNSLELDIDYIISAYDSGDINFDSSVNVLDVILLISVILENFNISNSQYNNADITDDGDLNIVDVISLIYIVLNN